jgi:hypothetical protein
MMDTNFNRRVSLLRRVVDALNPPLTYEGTVAVALASGTVIERGKIPGGRGKDLQGEQAQGAVSPRRMA